MALIPTQELINFISLNHCTALSSFYLFLYIFTFGIISENLYPKFKLLVFFSNIKYQNVIVFHSIFLNYEGCRGTMGQRLTVSAMVVGLIPQADD